MQSRLRFAPIAAPALVALAGLATPAAADITTRICLLTGSQETPPVTTNGLGAGRFIIDTCANTLTYRIVFSGMTSPEIAAHFHGSSDIGFPSGVVHPLPPGNVKTGVWNYPESLEADILGGRVYVNIHSANFGGGELRGQLVTHVAVIDPNQETPPVPGSNGRGLGLFTYNPAAHTLSYHITYGGLGSAETAAHIHGFTGHGFPSGVVHPLPATNPKVGVWTIPTGMDQAVIDGLTYVNIHTATWGGGEIRGQIVSSVNPADPQQETPSIPSTGSTGAGYSLISIDRANMRLGYDIAFTGLSSAETNCHFHGFSAPGTPSGVQHQLLIGPRKLGVWNYTAAQQDPILNGLSYTNIHTVNFGGGEIRGQLLFNTFGGPCAPPCYANCDGSTQTPVLNVGDFTCFLQRYANGESYANCDGSTQQPVLNVGDFTCFLQEYAGGCP
jgi:hypothetical protein